MPSSIIPSSPGEGTPGHQARISAYLEHLRSCIGQWVAGEFAPDDARFERLVLELFALQYEANPVYRSWCVSRRIDPSSLRSWREVPGLPAAAFKESPVTCLRGDGITTWFQSSGTTGQTPSRHFHDSVSLQAYEASFEPWFQHHALDRWTDSAVNQRLSWISLVPSRTNAPHSSLAYMIGRLMDRFAPSGSATAGIVGADGQWELESSVLIGALQRAQSEQRPVFLLGTAFNVVHVMDALEAAGRQFHLPAGSRVMETGGYKGRSRVLTSAELAQGIRKHLGIPAHDVLTEYGMSELSSQAYSRWSDDTGAGVLQLPPWARGMVISPETGREVSDGETGLLRLIDTANVASVLCLQTEDLAVRRGRDFQLLGRRPTAEARGCSLMSV
jgi:hypothetical protein